MLDQAALARHSDCVGDENASDKRIQYASNMYVDLKTKYDTHSSMDCLKTVMAYDVACSRFNSQALVGWTDTLLNRGQILSPCKNLLMRSMFFFL